MTWTYSGNPALSSSDQVRFELGDTDINDQQLQDEEIAYLLAQHIDPWIAAAGGCDALARKYSRQAQKTVGKISIAANQRAAAYRQRAQELRQQSFRTNGLPGIGMGGTSFSEKQAFGANPDTIQPNFSIGMDDTTGTAQPQSENPLLGNV